ncbi:MAG: protein kinase [Acidobacteria bacterium]|nr:protein kinase [Acidobacteriota bacterium]MBI3425338.1 protein kinase [Acidobacteriota bacterium]
METKRQSEQTKPMASFGTAPNITPALKQTNYSGVLLKDRYMIEGELGRGGIGVVYLARDTQLHQRRVVIKVLLESSEQSLHTPWFRKKFDQEIEALVRIDHPGVVGVLDVGAMPDGKPFFVMQFVEGVNLRSLMQQEMQAGKMDLARIAHIVRQIGQALTAAHEKGIIHRDLKPENVMVQRATEGEEVVKLIDFGIATVKDSQSNNTDSGKTKVAGALPYMAPEQLRGEPQSASDTWSLGVMTYELLTGHLPFNAETLVQLHEQQKKGAQPPPRELRVELSPAAEQVVLRAIAFAPEERFGRARDFGDSLAEALLHQIPRTVHTNSMSGQQLTSPSSPTELGSGSLPPVVAAPRPAPGKSPLPYFALIVVLLAGAVGIFSYFKLRNTPPSHLPENSGNTVVLPERILSYSISSCSRVKQDGSCAIAAKEHKQAIIFPPGSGLRLNFASDRTGYFYLFNEDPKLQNGLPVYNLLAPMPPDRPNAQLAAGQTLALPGANTYSVADAAQGTEKLWLIWSPTAVEEFEQLRRALGARKSVEVKEAAEAKLVQEFLKRNEAAKAVAELGDTQTYLKGKPGKLLLYLLELDRQ